MSRKYPITKSFGFAFRGFIECARKEPNFKVHLVLTLFALVFGYILEISPAEWLALFLAIGFVLFSELVHTAMQPVLHV